MKFNLLQKQTSRREILRGSATLAGSALLGHFFPPTLLRASEVGYGATNAFAGRPARQYARQVQRRSPRNTKSW
jgi:hypothetical protein